MTVAAIDLRAVRKEFGDFTALNSVSFEIADNEFFTLLGPSGCGKTTLLRMIAGFETPTSGSISVYGTQVAGLAPSQRPVNTVFQNYALFPHLDVTGNIGFGLRMLGWSKRDIAARVAEVLTLVKLEAFANRRPGQLSGGQQQRVALARAMAPKPKVLLLDEPLSALDLKLRQAMRSELKALQQETGITFVFVTHDQEEALTMSDRIAVMSAGDVQQIGRPSDIYEVPANRFVADFIGETNLLEVTVEALDGGTALCRLADGSVVPARGQAEVGAVRTLSIRPERLQFAAHGVAGRVERRVYLGTDVLFEVRLTDGALWSLRCQAGQAPDLDLGAAVQVAMDEGAARLLQG